MHAPTREEKIYTHLRRHYQELVNRGYEVVCVMLQGSQNYETDDEESDVDSKAIVLPKMKDIVAGTPPLSATIKFDNGEQVDVKDIRAMCQQLKKQNPSYLELLFTPYKIVSDKWRKDIKVLFDNADAIAAPTQRLFSSILGMACEKEAAIFKSYPSTAARIKKYGFDGKQLHHCLRLMEMMRGLANNKKFGDCLIVEDFRKQELMDIKRNKLEGLNIFWAGQWGRVAVMTIESFREDLRNEAPKELGEEVNVILDDLCYCLIKKNLEGRRRERCRKRRLIIVRSTKND